MKPTTLLSMTLMAAFCCTVTLSYVMPFEALTDGISDGDGELASEDEDDNADVLNQEDMSSSTYSNGAGMESLRRALVSLAEGVDTPTAGVGRTMGVWQARRLQDLDKIQAEKRDYVEKKRLPIELEETRCEQICNFCRTVLGLRWTALCGLQCMTLTSNSREFNACTTIWRFRGKLYSPYQP